MLIEKQFVMNAPMAIAWQLLLDVPRAAGCLPGATITEVVDAQHFKGSARVKVGPVQLVFAGEAELASVDEVAHVVRMRTRGSDTKGRGNVQADLVYRLEPQGNDTRVHIQMDLKLAGSVAQYGRATGLMDEIAGQYIAEFATNLKRLIGEPGAIAGQSSPNAPQNATLNASEVEPEAAEPMRLVPILWRALKAWVKSWFGDGTKAGSAK